MYIKSVKPTVIDDKLRVSIIELTLVDPLNGKEYECSLVGTRRGLTVSVSKKKGLTNEGE